MARYLVEGAIPETAEKQAAYLAAGAEKQPQFQDAAWDEFAEPRRDTHRDMAHLLRIDTSRNMSEKELSHLIAGNRADGGEIKGAHKKTITYIDFTFSADKSASVAFAFGDEATRAAILKAHRTAVAEAMRFEEAEIGWARRGDGGEDGAERGHIAWARIDHHASRPTLDLVNAEGATERIALKVPGDPNLHSHTIVPNHVLTASGHVGSLDTQRMDNKLGGRFYQAVLARELAAAGIDVELDQKTGSARLTAIPDHVRLHFSKSTHKAETLAREWAKQNEQDWDALPNGERIALVKRGAMAGRQHKESQPGETDIKAWRRQANDIGWRCGPVIRSDAPAPERLTRERRAEIAYKEALPSLEGRLAKTAVVNLSDLRLAAATGLVATKGVESPDEIGVVVGLMKERGVRQNGVVTQLVEGLDNRFTTEMHADAETMLVALAKTAAADRSLALSPRAMEAAVRRSGLDFSSEHGRQQRKMIDALGSQGKLAVALGVAGSGKTASLIPLVDAWKRDGRQVYGASLAWRQADDLKDAGIDQVFALSVLLKSATEPTPDGLKLDRNSVVVVDELGLIGTADMLQLLRVQKQAACKVIAIGDSLQCNSPEAGDAIKFLRRALGDDNIPKVSIATRQNSERERKIAALFRKGDATTAIAMKNEDGTLAVVPGGYDACARRVADLWAERWRETGGKVTVSAPTNEDARVISAAIRERRRQAGEIGPDVKVVKAIGKGDGSGYDLPLALGDRVRLFKSTKAILSDGRRRSIGRNGSTVEIVDIGRRAIKLRNQAGVEGVVKWSALADEDTGLIKLAHGDCLTIHTAQGLTSQEHIAAMPAGSRSLDAAKVYVAQSRHRQKSWLVTSDGAERAEIKERRPLGNETPITEADVSKNMARNLSRREEKSSALELLDAVQAARQDTRPIPAVPQNGAAARDAARLHRLKPAITRAMRHFSTKEQSMADSDKGKPQSGAKPEGKTSYEDHRRAWGAEADAYWRNVHKTAEAQNPDGETPAIKRRWRPRP